ncbi:undecaprenyl-phosphate galactosephosphotransferase [Rhodopirellula maiorica SM1]|uniref:Undecaprenyl-phosphate galactosephosphotransferase n=2 Tax=Novipirellula TaxID=2795426 RepID=M5RL66_9BACT|nr:undecaprenyl-phosphate galactosephosphotransferase [Rhodopirellula maiorica SM1]
MFRRRSVEKSVPPANDSSRKRRDDTDHSINDKSLSEPNENHVIFLRRKYAFDRCLGSVLLVLTAPLMLVLFVLVKLTSPGPGFYRQTRVGLNGKTFEIIKLRSMVKNAEKPGQAVWCVKHDSRVTWLGKILRKLHLDELPQLWNVAAGEMSLVGPRPERPEICESLAEQIELYYDRNKVKPGVTGLAQVNLPPDETIDDVRRKQILDLRYIEEANWWLDMRMITATAMRMVGVKGEVVMKMMGLCRRDLLRERLDSTDCFDGVCFDGGDDSHWSASKADRELVYAATSRRMLPSPRPTPPP